MTITKIQYKNLHSRCPTPIIYNCEPYSISKSCKNRYSIIRKELEIINTLLCLIADDFNIE